MAKWLFAVLVILTFIEVSLFVTLGGWLTLWPTLAVVVATAALGVMLLRWQGTHLLRDAKREAVTLHNPLATVAQGALIAIAGVLLILPGFFTDFLGLILLVPAVRSRIIHSGANRIADKALAAFQASRQHGTAETTPDHGVIDGEYSEVAGHEDPKRKPSGWTRP